MTHQLFGGYGKTNRLLRPAIYTEKLDGSNGSIVIWHGRTEEGMPEPLDYWLDTDVGWVNIWALSKNRVLGRGKNNDNMGFAAWVYDNRYMLAYVLGPGRHSGEWIGPSIQKNRYKLEEKEFALFNVSRWGTEEQRPHLKRVPGLTTVPHLETRTFCTDTVRMWLKHIERTSTFNPEVSGEGVCVYHTHTGEIYKATVDGDLAKEKMQ